ncbi:hypothetical protein WJX84_007602 [Apatococcus fuscideae]|uniref:Uncharacterized protein n=1 Tax=Apatococcus fuscideae TaxID=2026836 RepID=A0AAW1S181_9CHLO
MAEKDTTRRPKRRCARKQSVVPSAVHYVGYVEEDETPEMIMKKFEELERVMATSTAERPSEAGPSSASGDLLNLDSSEPGLEELAADQEAEERTLTEAQLMEVFKQTSIFNVKTALAGNEVLVGSEANQLDDVDQHALDDAELSDEEDSWEYMRGFWSDEDDGDYAEHWRQATKLGKASRRGARRSSGLPSAASRLATLTHYNAATRSLIRRRVHMHRWKFIYIENLTWVFLHANNSILQLPSPYARRSHITMLMFRREGLAGKRIELRHQRNPDVAFDCVASSPGQPHATPNEVFIAIETLLPTGKGEFLELWAANGTSRPGWTHVAEISSK